MRGRSRALACRGGAELVVGARPDPRADHGRAAARRRSRAIVRGTAEALPFRAATFDAAIACLVFEHIVGYEAAIAEVARVLKPGGRFVFMLNHPLLQAPNSGWVIDVDLDEQYWRVGPYLVPDLTMEQIAPGVVLPFVHRPLSHYVNAMARNGLLIERMEEPEPPEGFLAKAQEYRDAAIDPAPAADGRPQDGVNGSAVR